MIVIDQPFTSGLLINILEQTQYPVIGTEVARDILEGSGINFISEIDAVNSFKSSPGQGILTNSENALHWIENMLGFTEFPANARVFKDKGMFRDLVKHLYPDYYYKVIQQGLLTSIDNINYV